MTLFPNALNEVDSDIDRDNAESREMECRSDFVFGCLHYSKIIHEISTRQGFWTDGQDRNIGEMIALVHSELSEALECLRMGNPPDKNIKEFSGAEVQLADALILLLDMTVGFGLRIPEAALHKIAFNRTREYKHGKTF